MARTLGMPLQTTARNKVNPLRGSILFLAVVEGGLVVPHVLMLPGE